MIRDDLIQGAYALNRVARALNLPTGQAFILKVQRADFDRIISEMHQTFTVDYWHGGMIKEGESFIDFLGIVRVELL